MRALIIGERYRHLLEKPLIFNGFEPIWLPENPNVDLRLASHTDLSVFRYKKNVVLASYLSESLLVKILTNRGLKVLISHQTQYKEHPGDVNLCAAAVGGYLLHNSSFTDETISNNICLKPLHVKQGYAACTTLVINDEAIISSDSGILKAAKKAGIDTLQISGRSILLEGFGEGFIGGASFTTENTVYFTGDITNHPDAALITGFIQRHGMTVCCLSEGNLMDIGGAVCVE